MSFTMAAHAWGLRRVGDRRVRPFQGRTPSPRASRRRSADQARRARVRLLIALIEASGAVVSKDVLLDRVWPGRIVEENRLQNQVSALRKAFGADHDLIRTVAGRGYQFTGQIRARSADSAVRSVRAIPPGVPAASDSPTNLPGRVSELIGRDAELGEIQHRLAGHRLSTLSVVGGIRRTTP